jgi:glycosyltransferase involved in cell wall biosynthesis
MRIAIDTHAIGTRQTGNERYIESLVKELLSGDGQNEYFFFFTHEQARKEWENRTPNLKTFLVSRNPWLRLAVDLPLQLHRLRPSVFHYQYTGPLFHVSPEVVTIHDVSFERYPEFFTASERSRLRLTVRRAANVARRIITVSEFSRAEIVKLLGVPEHKIKVIYNGVGEQFDAIRDPDAIRACLKRYSVEKPYLLAVGNISRRKNHLAMIRGFARWLDRCPKNRHQLVIAGKPQDAATEVFAEASRLGLDQNRLKILGFVPDYDLPYLYSGSEVLLNTSVYEGFGLPLIEAMRCSVPVIASRASCFPEITGDAARLVDPQDAGDIGGAIEQVLADEAARKELVAHGLKRAQLFRWDDAARETLKVYAEAVTEGGIPLLS